MKKFLSVILVFVFLLTLLTACQKKEEPSIVGSWYGEVGDQHSTFNFYEDGTGLAINTYEKEIPMTYTIKSDTRVDIVFNIDGEEVSENSNYEFEGNDTLILDGIALTRQK